MFPHSACTLRFLTSVALLAAASASQAATISVNSTLDDVANDGLCSLREAIMAANLDLPSGNSLGECAAGDPAGQDQIVFAIPGPGIQTLMPATELPPISSSLSLDGYTQPGASANSISALTAGFDAQLRIRIDGSLGGAISHPGLRIISPATQVRIRGLEISGFTSSSCCADTAIVVAGGTSSIQIVGNMLHHNNWRGIFVGNSGPAVQNLEIGGPQAADRNLIYAQAGSQGIAMSNCQNCRVQNNWIGVRADNGLPAAAGNQTGIQIDSSPLTVIHDNWIAGNSFAGVLLFSQVSQVTLRDNLIGGSFANGSGVRGYNNGANAPQDNLILDNVISGNLDVGVGLSNSLAGTTLQRVNLQGNRIYANGGVEIDLGADGGALDGVTANDVGDLDQGPNGLQNFPVLAAPVIDGGQFSIAYMIDAPALSYTLEFAFASQCDGSGHGLQGQMSSDPVVLTDMPAAGPASFALPAVPSSGFVSALATSADGTSEYSSCQPYSFVDGLLSDGFE
jgi:CSLREA domain-containing protein